MLFDKPLVRRSAALAEEGQEVQADPEVQGDREPLEEEGHPCLRRHPQLGQSTPRSSQYPWPSMLK
jgi:hypothetical protein